MLCLGGDWQSLNVTLKVQGDIQASLLSVQAESALVEVAEETVACHFRDTHVRLLESWAWTRSHE